MKLLKFQDPIIINEVKSSISSIAISPDGKEVATGSMSGEIIFWDLLSQKQLRHHQDNENTVISALQYSKNQIYIAAAQELYNYPCDILLLRLDDSTQIIQVKLKGHSCIVWNLAFVSDYILSVSKDRTFKLWHVQQYKPIYSRDLQYQSLGLSVTSNQRFFSLCCQNGSAYLYNIQNIRNPKKLAQWDFKDEAYGTKFTPTSNNLITISRYIKIWNLKKFNLIRTIQCEAVTRNVDVVFNGNVLVTIDKKIKFWNIGTSELLNKLDLGFFPQELSKIFSIRFDMKYIVVGGILKIYILEENQNI